MANYNTLNADIVSVIKANGNAEITGPILQATLLAMVNSLGRDRHFAGLAFPATNPGNPDNNVFWLAYEKGVYANFAGIATAKKGLYFLLNDIAVGWFVIEIPLATILSAGTERTEIIDVDPGGGTFPIPSGLAVAFAFLAESSETISLDIGAKNLISQLEIPAGESSLSTSFDTVSGALTVSGNVNTLKFIYYYAKAF